MHGVVELDFGRQLARIQSDPVTAERRGAGHHGVAVAAGFRARVARQSDARHRRIHLGQQEGIAHRLAQIDAAPVRHHRTIGRERRRMVVVAIAVARAQSCERGGRAGRGRTAAAAVHAAASGNAVADVPFRRQLPPDAGLYR
ncbi:hypothetical protein D9M72_274200 [compost metagenome]